ncbi:MAG: nucleoside deaminase [bacterium]|nr:nucleoside deaminase [bacterium]
MPVEVRLCKKYMKLAVKEALRNLEETHGGPFGACIVREERILSVARNTVLKQDATSHAEINAIRDASKKLKTFDLSGCVIYSTTEPCPMCFGAIHWAKIDALVYGTSISEVKMRGFNELTIANSVMKRLGKSQVKIFPHFLRDECRQLLEKWDSLEKKCLY